MVSDVYGMETEKQFVNTLEDCICYRGEPNGLISDHDRSQLSSKVNDLLRSLCIKQWSSEPYQQHQNPSERHYQTIKTFTNTVLDRTGSPTDKWLL